MRITDVRLRTVKNENELKLKAYADVTFEECFVIHGLKVIDGQKGMFVAMPSRKMPDGEYKDIAHPITPELRKDITDSVIAKYKEVMEQEVTPIEVVEIVEE
ncbi:MULTISPECIES: septation regulator SpoVG [Cetobacterium]|jgi:stage V sporulation protein G|uniref:Putative septation protein SpoVG n=1 Tax=Candidatus Cetobacterium colombiensis TaxID=3073100 RepID=A0ABU4WB73_9FUSO|nr:septation regulator SpoVG [Candidatus Cetobacterium colombiensis]MDX8336793.1 septation regulator SpoVG [Candidatus Cetobacterium colombiensis]